MYRRYTDLSNFVEDLWPHLYLLWLNYLRPILIVALTLGSRTSVYVVVLMNQCRCGIILTNGFVAISDPFMLLTFADVRHWDQAWIREPQDQHLELAKARFVSTGGSEQAGAKLGGFLTNPMLMDTAMSMMADPNMPRMILTNICPDFYI